MELQDMRIDYRKGEISDDSLPDHPMAWFGTWLEEAISANIEEANAMVLSTVSIAGTPSSRVVLLKAFDERGLLFFTNYESRKGSQISYNPAGALLFFWPDLERQIRIEGSISKADNTISDDYFYSRSLESRVSAAVSPQSKVVETRELLEKMHSEFLLDHQEEKFHRPDNWGGYWLQPDLFEFWQGRSNRLNDRIQFQRLEEGWIRSRLAP